MFENEIYSNTSLLIDDDIIAMPDCLIVKGNVEHFLECIGENSFVGLEFYSSVLSCLSKVPLFKNFCTKKLETLSKSVIVKNYRDNEIIIKQGEIGSGLKIVKSGKIDILINNKYIRTLNQNEFLGERSLFIDERRSATAVSHGHTQVFIIKKNDFLAILENNLKEHLLNRIFLQDDCITLQDLEYVKDLGHGSYGKVCLVQNKKNKYFYAIKSMPIAQIFEEKLNIYISREKSILLKIDHPFIMKLVKTLKDSFNIYFISEYIRGKELFEVIREIGILSNKQTKFFAASIILAIDYLHKRNIVYRDVKPENIIVSERVKWINLGLY